LVVGEGKAFAVLNEFAGFGDALRVRLDARPDGRAFI
jgi:hypothetical protein